MADETETEKPSFDATMDASMNAVFDQIEAREKAAEVGADNSPPSAAKSDAPASGGPPRSPDGKFTKAAPEAAAPTKLPDQAQTAAAETPPASIDAPQSWSADVRAKWATLPPDLQAYIAKRESESHQQITQSGDRLKAYDNLQRVLEPRRARLVSQFGSEWQAVDTLLNLAEVADRDFPGFVREQARLRGIDLSQLTPAPAPQFADPNLAALYNRLQGLETQLTQQTQAQAQAQQAAIEQEIAEFAKDRPHFEGVRSLMGSLIQSGQAKNLEEAYEQATWAKPDVRTAILAEQQAKAKAQAEEEAKKRAAEAQRHAAINVTTKGKGHSPAPSKSWDQTMSEAYDRVNAA